MSRASAMSAVDDASAPAVPSVTNRAALIHKTRMQCRSLPVAELFHLTGTVCPAVRRHVFLATRGVVYLLAPVVSIGRLSSVKRRLATLAFQGVLANRTADGCKHNLAHRRPRRRQIHVSAVTSPVCAAERFETPAFSTFSGRLEAPNRSCNADTTSVFTAEGDNHAHAFRAYSIAPNAPLGNFE